jgi:sigma-B regulation protein RsbU (phosphoserine phosphatase)
VLPKAVKILVIIITVAVVSYYGFFFTQDAIKFANWRKAGMVESNIGGPDSNTVFATVDTADFVSRPFPSPGDQLLTINDTVVTGQILGNNLNAPHPPGYEVRITYRSKDSTYQTTIKSRPHRPMQVVIQTVLMSLRFLISIGFLIVGIWAFAKRPNSGAVRALTLFCYSLGVFLTTAITSIVGRFGSISFIIFTILQNGMSLLALFFGGFWLNLQLLFPSPREFIKKHPIRAYGLCYFFPTAIFIGSLFGQSNFLGISLIVLIIGQVGTGFYLLSKYHRRTTEPIEKRQTRLVLWGTGPGLIAFGLLISIAVIASYWSNALPEMFLIASLIIVFLSLLLSPISFAYAFGKYGLLEIEGRIRRGTRHFLIGLGLLAAFYVLIYFSSEFTLEVLGVQSRTPVLMIALVLAIGFAPAQRRLQGALDRRIYPERFRLKGMVDDFLRQSMATTDKKAFWNELENKLRAALKVDQIYPVLRAANNGHFEHWSGATTPFLKESHFIEAISRVGGRPVMRDELEAGERTSFTPEEKDWFISRRVAMVLPMITRSELIGFLGIGLKSEKQDFEPADFEILHSLANQIAMATDNILLLEENAEKKRMETELSIARKVQEGMLPHDMPATPGLEVATRCRFCTEVAGDYYDIIDAGEGRTILAIGDVSGKGAGAALLMSNVQASLRTVVGIERDQEESGGSGTASKPVMPDLSRVIRNINHLIYQNSQPDQFITFFAAIYDAGTGMLDFVNAGHNMPLVVKSDGSIAELLDGGIFLGAVPDFPYQKGTIKLEATDVLFMYTDGLSEAGAQRGEMFGEERLKEFLAANRNLTPEELLKNLEKEVMAFLGEFPLGDDFTLVAAKVK